MGLSEIDLNLRDAWVRIGEKCRRDRMEALRRSKRRFTPMLADPPRARCLCIRASDRRINCETAYFQFPVDEVYAPDERWDDSLRRGLPHLVTLFGSTIREITRPISIPWPGEPQYQVAKLLGRHRDNITHWIDRTGCKRSYGYDISPRSLATRDLPPGSRAAQPRLTERVLKLWGYVKALTKGKHGLPLALLYTNSPIDPNGPGGRPPDPVWGTLWRHLWEYVPEQYEQVVERVPYDFTGPRGTHQKGWQWVCPGRIGPDGEFNGCGRLVRKLYMPMPMFTIAHMCGVRHALDMPDGSGLAGQWHPGEHSLEPDWSELVFACDKCWRVQRVSMAKLDGWNRLVSFLSGGLLYGHEVERPQDEAPLVRKDRPHKQPPKESPRRDLAVRLAMQGVSYQEIAQRLGISHKAVPSYIYKTCLKHGVRGRKALFEKLRREEADAAARCEVGAAMGREAFSLPGGKGKGEGAAFAARAPANCFKS